MKDEYPDIEETALRRAWRRAKLFPESTKWRIAEGVVVAAVTALVQVQFPSELAVLARIGVGILTFAAGVVCVALCMLGWDVDLAVLQQRDELRNWVRVRRAADEKAANQTLDPHQRLREFRAACDRLDTAMDDERSKWFDSEAMTMGVPFKAAMRIVGDVGAVLHEYLSPAAYYSAISSSLSALPPDAWNDYGAAPAPDDRKAGDETLHSYQDWLQKLRGRTGVDDMRLSPHTTDSEITA